MDDKENEEQEDMRLLHYRDAKCNERLEIKTTRGSCILAVGFAVCGLEAARMHKRRQKTRQKIWE